MIFSFPILAPLLAPLLAPFVVAQSSSGPDVSAQCQSTLLKIFSSSEGQCLNAAGLVSVFLTSSDTSVVGPVQNWLTGLCSKDPCTNQTLATIVSDITQGCSSDLSPLGINGDVSSITAYVQQYYPVVREIVCLKDNSAGQLCLIEELYKIQNNTGTLTTDNIFSLDIVPMITLPQNVTCNNCNKEAYNIIITKFPDITSNADSTISKLCGADFVDGKTPADISQTAAGSNLPK